MAAPAASEFFEHLAEYNLAVCKECRYAVWPDQIEGHLQGRNHKINRKKAIAVAEDVRRWPCLIQYPSELVVPDCVSRPIQQVPLYDDGLICKLDSERCRYIARGIDSIRKHWYTVHQWSAGGTRGGSGRNKKRRVDRQLQEAVEQVQCQRLFTQGRGSQFFEVRQPEKIPEDRQQEPAASGEALWTQVRSKIAAQWAEIEKKARDTIQEGGRDEVNPWLERTQWQPYLRGLQRPELLGCIREPTVAEPDRDRRSRREAEEEPDEPVERVIWEAMDELARISQASVVERVGVFVRLEAIRTEKHQTRYQPLQPYMDEKSIGDHVRPWKQMLMFFARTQKEHDWQSPKYRFTRRQREAWEVLVKEAEQKVSGEAEEEEEEEKGGEEEEEDEEDVKDSEDSDGSEHGNDDEEVQNRDKENNRDDQPEKLTAIQRACLEFCIQLLNQTISRKEYDSALVCALAVLGVKEGGWKGPEQYPPILSAVIKVARFMIVQQALELSEPFREDEFNNDDSGYDSDSSADSAQAGKPRGCLDFVAKMMDRFMVRGSRSPMQWMLDLRTYGLKIHYNTTSTGHVEWKGYDELLYKDLHFTMPQFRGMVHGLVAETRRLLVEDLLSFGNKQRVGEVPQIPWQSLRDNPTDERPGWNFLQDHRSRLPVDGETWLFDRVGQDAAVRDRFLKPGSESGIDRTAVERYMSQAAEFKEKLLVLMHITGGQPARGPEILSVRHSNTIRGGHRNIFIEDGLVVYVTRYHKGYALSGDIKIIHRYLPREVGELLVWYLWLALPFQQRIEAMVWKKDVVSAHVWPADADGKKWTSERMRKALKRESMVGLGQGFTIQSYRDIAIGISRRFMRGATAFNRPEGGEGDDDDDEGWDEESIAAAIADAQAGHTSHIAGMVYARAIMEQFGAIADKRRQFRASSMDWHRFLGFGSAAIRVEEERQATGKRKRAPFDVEADEGRMERWKRLRKMDAEAELRRMMDKKEAEFRGVQREAVEAIAAGESPVVVVMPTGGGKSLVFMLPAWIGQGSGTTVVVVPLIALRGDMKRRCKEVGISCEEWEGRRQPDAAAVVLVTPESAVSEDFTTFLNRLKATRQLDRIVIDECHIVLNRKYTFRKQMQQLGKLVMGETQMVLLTATLPPCEEEELYKRMHFDRRLVKMFRERTTRKNVAYRVVDISEFGRKADKEEFVLALIEKKVRDAEGIGKVVVYCNSTTKVKTIAEALSCDAFYHDAVGKEAMLEDFRMGKRQVIVATNALGMGIDIPDIRCIVHADRPRTLLDYAQESGRAGRDGRRSEAIVVEDRAESKWLEREQTEEEKRLVKQYVGSSEEAVKGCRRAVLDEYLDGWMDRVGCEEGEQKCDVCKGVKEGEGEGEGEEEGGEGEEMERGIGQEGVARGVEEEEERKEFRRQEKERTWPRQEFIKRRQEEFSEFERLRRGLQRWIGRCGICEWGQLGPSNHGLMECERVESIKAREVAEEIRRTIRYERYSGCFDCGVPQAICSKWEDNGQGGWRRRVDGGECQYRNVLLGGILGIIFGVSRGVWQRWQRRLEEFGVDLEEKYGLGSLVEYLGRKRRLEQVESNNLAGEFCWLIGLVEE